MKLNIGSNTERIDGFTNLDIRAGAHVDIVDDAATLSTITRGSCTEIIAYNILEHFPYDATRDVLGCWVSCMAFGGKITVGVPDTVRIMERFSRSECTRAKYRSHPWDDVQHSVFGNLDTMRKWHGDKAALYGHQALFSRAHLEYLMTRAGLVDITDCPRNHKDNVTLSGVMVYA